ncbi:MAG: type II toxin-antitoxin system VapC family toxin [bacterium]
MNTYVLDSYALLQYFQNEPDSEILEKVLSHCHKMKRKALLSLINWGEIYYIVKRRFGDNHLQTVLQHIEQLPIQCIPVDEEIVQDASELKAQYPISYADSFCAAVAQKHKAVLVTGDPEFKVIEKVIPILWTNKDQFQPDEL